MARETKKQKERELLMPRVMDEETLEEGYLHWTALEILFREQYPQGKIELKEIGGVSPQDAFALAKEICTEGLSAAETLELVKGIMGIVNNKAYVTIQAKVWYEPPYLEENAVVTTSYQKQYTDDVCDTYMSCQKMAFRDAMMLADIGIETAYENEKNKRMRAEGGAALSAEPQELPENPTTKQMFDALVRRTAAKPEKVDPEDFIEKSAEPAEESVKPSVPEISAEETEEKPAQAEEETPCANTTEETPAAEPVEEPAEEPAGESVTAEPAKEEEMTEEEPPAEEEAPATSDDAEEAENSLYVIKPGDFLLRNYDRKFSGKTIDEVPVKSLRTIRMNERIVTKEFMEEIRKFMGE